jgi:hypothetical protein
LPFDETVPEQVRAILSAPHASFEMRARAGNRNANCPTLDTSSPSLWRVQGYRHDELRWRFFQSS